MKSGKELFIFYLFIYLCICLFAISSAAPTAYGGSQARGPIRAVATSLHQSHSNTDPSRVWDLHHSAQQLVLTVLVP